MTEEVKEEVKETPMITIDDKTYALDDFDDKQRRLLSHLANLNEKIIKNKFELEQLTITHGTMKNILTNSLNVTAEDAQAAADAAKADSEK